MTAVWEQMGQLIFSLSTQSHPLLPRTTMGLDSSCRSHGMQQKCNPTALWLNLGGLKCGHLMGEERAERP